MKPAVLTPDVAKHGLAAGDAGKPANADWTIPQHWDAYTAEEHAVWRTLYQRQTRLLPGRACDAYLQGLDALPIGADGIPRFEAINETLMRRTGWQVVAVPGLVPDDVFYHHLVARRFPVGQFIRRPDQLDYLQEPDVFHDVFGHVPMLMHPVMGDFMQAYGEGGLRAQRLGRLEHLARLYWYTVEFGLVRAAPGSADLRIYGAGIVSSASETRFSLESPSPNRIGFDLERVMRTRYRIDDFQQTYFVLDSLDDLLRLAQIDFAPVYERLADGAEHDAFEVREGEAVFTRGDRSHHQAAASPATGGPAQRTPGPG